MLLLALRLHSLRAVGDWALFADSGRDRRCGEQARLCERTASLCTLRRSCFACLSLLCSLVSRALSNPSIWKDFLRAVCLSHSLTSLDFAFTEAKLPREPCVVEATVHALRISAIRSYSALFKFSCTLIRLPLLRLRLYGGPCCTIFCSFAF